MSPLSDYSSMEQEIRNAPEPKILPKGVSVKARIILVNSGFCKEDSKSPGARYYSPVFDIPDDPMVKQFNDFFYDPLDREKTDPGQYAKNMDKFNKFTKCFGIDLTKPFAWEDDLPGKSGWIITGIQHDDDYGDKNSVSKYVTGPGNSQNRPAAGTASTRNDSDIPF